MRIAVVTDSNSGITQKMAAEMGVFVLPMPFMIDGETYFEDINLTQEEFYEKLANDADISTSQPSPESVMELWDEALGEYDQVVHIPMSSGLSGSCQTAVMLSMEDKYEDKVFVVDNQRISLTLEHSIKQAQILAAAGLDGAQIKKRLEDTKLDAAIFITVDTLKYLKKGGRITPAVAMIGTLLKIKPILSIFGDKLDSFAKSRTVKQAKVTMVEAILKELSERLDDPEGRHSCIGIAHTQNEVAAQEFAKEVRMMFPYSEVSIAPLSLSVSCHIGPGSLAITASRKLVEEDETIQK